MADPHTGGGKIKLDPPIVAPIPPPRGIWGIVLPVALLVGIVGLIGVMYASGARQLAGGFGLFGGMAAFSAIGMVVRNRGAGKKMSWGELYAARRKWFSRQDDIRDEVDVQRRLQWEHRQHFHWAPEDLSGIAGSVRMWDRRPGADNQMFSVVRVGLGRVKLAMTLEKPEIAPAADLEPATGHALRKFLNAQEYISDVPKAISLQQFPAVSFVGDMEQARSLTRAMICQLTAFHSPSDLQLIIVSGDPEQWDWAKWLPHMQHSSSRDGCGERRMLFSSPAELEAFLDEDPSGGRPSWSQPSSGLGGGGAVLPLRVIIDDGCGTAEDWAGLTGAVGYASTCFIRLAAHAPARPGREHGGSRYWLGFEPNTTYSIHDGVLRKQASAVELGAQRQPAQAVTSDEGDEAFYAVADQMSIDAAEQFARTLAPYRAQGAGGTAVATVETGDRRTVIDVLDINDPRHLDFDRLWAATRNQSSPKWMKFPIGTYSDTGEVAEINLREGSQGGMNMHSLFIGTTGAGKSEGLITEVAGATLTHSPEVLNIVFTDFKLKSAAGVIGRFPHVVASISNLSEEKHLVGRFYDALDGELDRRGEMIAALDDCPDVTTYNHLRQSDPTLPPIPALWVITDEYNEVFADPIYGPKFRRLYLRIARVGRSLHVFLRLVGQTKDQQNLRDIDKLLGFVTAARTGTESESTAAIGSKVAAMIPPSGEEGTAYLRVAKNQPRKYRYFFTSGEWFPRTEDDNASAGPGKTLTEFEPREFGVEPAPDLDNRVARVEVPEVIAPVEPAAPTEKYGKLVRLITDSMQQSKERPPRPFWLPVLDTPTPADELVLRWRGKPWYVDYGKNPGLTLPVALADYPRGARQETHCLDLLNDNGMVISAPQRGATTAMMTMVTSAALLYTPERVQFYVVANSGPQFARLSDLPHVAAVAAGTDQEAVARVIGAVETIAADRDRIFNTQGLDMDRVREYKFGPNPREIGVEGGDVILIVDGWKNFQEAHPKLTERVMSLLRARNYGVHVVLTHTSSLSGLHSSINVEVGQRLELKLVNEHDSGIKRNPADPERNPVREVPDRPGRGLTPTGHHLLVGWPSIAHPPQRVGEGAAAQWVAGDESAPAVEGEQLAQVVRDVAGSSGVSMARLPAIATMAEILAKVTTPLERDVVAFGLRESNLGPATLDFFEDPHVVATGTMGGTSGLSTFLRAVMTGIMNSKYTQRDATIIQFDPRQSSIDFVPAVPGNQWRGAYATTVSQMQDIVGALRDILNKRRPPLGATLEDIRTRKFWEGDQHEIFLVVDGITGWSGMSNPLNPLAEFIEEGSNLGFHVVATADVRRFGFESQGGVLGKMISMQTPLLIMDGHRSHGQLYSGLYAEPQRPGKGLLHVKGRTEGVLVGWTEPPAPRQRR
nr:ESX secretion system protein EccC [Mycolicibacterium sp.]